MKTWDRFCLSVAIIGSFYFLAHLVIAFARGILP